MTTDELREMREAFEQSQRELFGFWAGSLQYRAHLGRYEDQEEDRRWQTFKAAWTLATNRERERAAKVIELMPWPTWARKQGSERIRHLDATRREQER